MMTENKKSFQKTLRDLTLLLGSMMTITVGAAIAPALPQIHRNFYDIPHSVYLVKLILTFPALFIALGAYFFGYLMDRWGRKPVLVLSVILYGLAGSSGFYLDSIYLLLASRAVLGFSIAGIVTGFTTLIADFFVDRHLNRFMGLQASAMAFGAVLFLVTAGMLADLGWHYPFLLYLFSFIVLPALLFFIKEPQRQRDPNQKGPSGSSQPTPMLTLLLVYACAFIGWVIFIMVPTQLPFHMKSLLGISNTHIGFAIATKTFFAGITALFYPKIKEILSYKWIFSIAFLLLGLGFLIISLSLSYYQFILGLMIGGLGMGVLLPNLSVWVVSSVPQEVRGRAIGGLATAIFLGQFFSPIISQPIIEELDMHRGFALAGMVMMLLALLFTFIRSLPQKAEHRLAHRSR